MTHWNPQTRTFLSELLIKVNRPWTQRSFPNNPTAGHQGRDAIKWMIRHLRKSRAQMRPTAPLSSYWSKPNASPARCTHDVAVRHDRDASFNFECSFTNCSTAGKPQRFCKDITMPRLDENTQDYLQDAERGVRQSTTRAWDSFSDFALRDNVLEVAVGLMYACALPHFLLARY